MTRQRGRIAGRKPRQGAGRGGVDTDAIHDNVAGEVAAIPSATVASGDHILIEDLDDDRQCLQCGYIAYARRPKKTPPEAKRRPRHGRVNL